MAFNMDRTTRYLTGEENYDPSSASITNSGDSSESTGATGNSNSGVKAGFGLLFGSVVAIHLCCLFSYLVRDKEQKRNQATFVFLIVMGAVFAGAGLICFLVYFDQESRTSADNSDVVTSTQHTVSQVGILHLLGANRPEEYGCLAMTSVNTENKVDGSGGQVAALPKFDASGASLTSGLVELDAATSFVQISTVADPSTPGQPSNQVVLNCELQCLLPVHDQAKYAKYLDFGAAMEDSTKTPQEKDTALAAAVAANVVFGTGFDLRLKFTNTPQTGSDPQVYYSAPIQGNLSNFGQKFSGAVRMSVWDLPPKLRAHLRNHENFNILDSPEGVTAVDSSGSLAKLQTEFSAAETESKNVDVSLNLLDAAQLYTTSHAVILAAETALRSELQTPASRASAMGWKRLCERWVEQALEEVVAIGSS